MKTRMVVAHFGHAEDSYASFMVFLAEYSFGSSVEALNELAHGLLVKFVEEDSPERLLPRACCQEARERAREGDLFCSVCGQSLHKKAVLPMWRFCDYIAGLLSQPLDGYGDLLSDIGPWSEFSTMDEILEVPREEIVEIHERAECLLPFALKGDEFDDPGHAFHELADSLRDAVKGYWEDHPWVPHEPSDHADLERIVDEHYRVKESR